MASTFQDEYKRKLLPVEDAAKLIQSGDKIVGAIAISEPTVLLDAIGKRAAAHEIENVEYICQGPNQTSHWVTPEVRPYMRLNTGFIVNPIGRIGVNKGYADYTPMHGSDFPDILCDYMIKDRGPGTTKICIMVGPMDHLGYFCLGTGPGYTLEAAKLDHTTVIVQVNESMPYVAGDNFIHVSEVDYIIEHNVPLAGLIHYPDPSPEDIAIAENIAELVEDGATLQLGFGSMPNVLGKLLTHKRELGAHSEQVGDAFMILWKAGALTGSKKTVKPGKITGCFSMGAEGLFEWLNNNPVVELYSQKWTNNPFVIAQNYKMTSVNQTLEVDFTGQASSEAIGTRQYSGAGGQHNYVLGSVYAPGGKAILCLQSTANTKEGRVSNIVPMFRQGTPVTTPRNDVQYVVTEYGVAQLRGKSIRQRTQELINIAHPDFREDLRREAKRLLYL